jgi:hypothetical protein
MYSTAAVLPLRVRCYRVVPPFFISFYWRLIRSPECNKCLKHITLLRTRPPQFTPPSARRSELETRIPLFPFCDWKRQPWSSETRRTRHSVFLFPSRQVFPATAALNLVFYCVPRGAGPSISSSIFAIILPYPPPQQASRSVRSSGRRDTQRLWRWLLPLPLTWHDNDISIMIMYHISNRYCLDPYQIFDLQELRLRLRFTPFMHMWRLLVTCASIFGVMNKTSDQRHKIWREISVLTFNIPKTLQNSQWKLTPWISTCPFAKQICSFLCLWEVSEVSKHMSKRYLSNGTFSGGYLRQSALLLLIK